MHGNATADFIVLGLIFPNNIFFLEHFDDNCGYKTCIACNCIVIVFALVTEASHSECVMSAVAVGAARTGSGRSSPAGVWL